MNYELSAIITPGLEQHVLSEFNFKRFHYFDSNINIDTKKETGAVVFFFKDISVFNLIKILRSPTKFTVKVSEFKCRDFPKLFNKISNIDWKNYIYSEKVSISTTCRKSRIIHTERVNETAKRSVEKWLSGNPRKKLPLSEYSTEQKIIINIDTFF